MPENTKIPKEAVLYMNKRNTKYQCKDCALSKAGGNKCAAYGPDVFIKPYGACGLFFPKKGNAEVPFVGTATKLETGYVEDRNGFTCGRCDEFLDGNDCKKIDKDSAGDDPGEILASACCNRWEPKKENNG